MGCGQSKSGMFANTNGDGNDFLNKYNVERIIGQGEFGLVKLVYAKNADDTPIACKIIRKGMQFKDNTLYAPINPHVLKNELGILRILNGKHHTLKLIGVYESPSTIFILTEYMSGGDMYQYLTEIYGATGKHDGSQSNMDNDTTSSHQHGLRTEDVSRMSYQLLDAVNHCAKHDIMHRDIKPENIMFDKPERGSSLKLIDFGSGTFCATSTDTDHSKRSQYDLNNPLPPGQEETTTQNHSDKLTKIQNSQGDELFLHTTFAGSGFFISPEMFHKHYTKMTDVWSAGVVLYVLVAGYPADALQNAFNKLHSNERTISTLKTLPHMPENMPETYFEMLHSCLIYKHRLRKNAGDILDTCEFIRFHREHDIEAGDNDDNVNSLITLDEITNDAKSNNRTKSVLIEGSVTRHTAMLKYGQFERSVTSLLAALLDKEELKLLLGDVDHLIDTGATTNNDKNKSMNNRKKLQIITVGELKEILVNLKFNHILPEIEKISHGIDYSKFAYHVAFLRQFYTVVVREEEQQRRKDRDDESFGDLDISMNRKWKRAMTKRKPVVTPKNKEEEESAYRPQSIHNGNMWDTISKQLNTKQPRRKSF